jgi:hypothetical protein
MTAAVHLSIVGDIGDIAELADRAGAEIREGVRVVSHASVGSLHEPVNRQQRHERGQSGGKDPIGLPRFHLAAFGAGLGVARDISAARYAFRH